MASSIAGMTVLVCNICSCRRWMQHLLKSIQHHCQKHMQSYARSVQYPKTSLPCLQLLYSHAVKPLLRRSLIVEGRQAALMHHMQHLLKVFEARGAAVNIICNDSHHRTQANHMQHLLKSIQIAEVRQAANGLQATAGPDDSGRLTLLQLREKQVSQRHGPMVVCLHGDLLATDA